MKHLKLYEEYSNKESQFLTDENEIRNWLSKNLDKYDEFESHISIVDGVVNVYTLDDFISGDKLYEVYFREQLGLDYLPIQFGEVYSNFIATGVGLKSLKGSPTTCINYDVSYNYITTLEYIPKYIMGDLYLNSNPIVTLDYKPETLNGIPFEQVSYKVIDNGFSNTLLFDPNYRNSENVPASKHIGPNDGNEEAVVEYFVDILKLVMKPTEEMNSRRYPLKFKWNEKKFPLSDVLSQIEKYLPKYWEILQDSKYKDILSWGGRVEKASKYAGVIKF